MTQIQFTISWGTPNSTCGRCDHNEQKYALK